MKVVCIADGPWISEKGFWIFKWNVKAVGPRKDDIVTVSKERWIDGDLCYRFIEWPGRGDYMAKYFAPVEESTTEYSEVTFTEIKKETPVPSEN